MHALILALSSTALGLSAIQGVASQQRLALGALPQRNLLGNGGFESWSNGESPGGSLAPDLWYAMGDPTGAFTQLDVQFTRTQETPTLGTASPSAVKLVPDASGNFMSQAIPSGPELAGNWVTFSVDFRPEPSFAVAKPSIAIDDGVTITSICQVIFSADGWTRLSVEHLVDDEAPKLEFRIIPGGIVEANDAMAVMGKLGRVAYVPIRAPESSLRELPLGAVVDWYRFDPNVPVPDGFAICDGSTVAEPNSPFFGLATPDLSNRFVKGVVSASTIGITGGAETVDLRHSHDMHHTHSGRTDPHFSSWWFGNEFMGPQGSDRAHTHDFTTGGPSNGSTGNALADTPIEPPFFGLLKLVRIR